MQLVIPGNDPALLAKTRVWVESVIQGFKGLEKDDPVRVAAMHVRNCVLVHRPLAHT